MQRFYKCSENELLKLRIPRFWKKYENMLVLELENRRDALIVAATARNNQEVNRQLYRINWKIEQLSGEEQKPDGLKDIKASMEKTRKAAKKKKKKVKK